MKKENLKEISIQEWMEDRRWRKEYDIFVSQEDINFGVCQSCGQGVYVGIDHQIYKNKDNKKIKIAFSSGWGECYVCGAS